MSKRALILYILLLVVPVIVLGGAAAWLMGREQQRLDERLRTDAMFRAQDMAQNIANVIEGIQDGVIDSLASMSETDLVTSLRAVRDENPLVRNVFAWHPDEGLELPRLGKTASGEEHMFATRYDALFSGRTAWEHARGEELVDAPASQAPLDRQNSSSRLREAVQSITTESPSWGRVGYRDAAVKGKYDNRSEIKKLSRLDQYAQKADPAPASPESRSGWIPWFWEDQLYMLGWYQPDPGARMRGIELEMIALLSRLLPEMTALPAPGLVFRLVDGNGAAVYQAGEGAVPEGRDALLSVPVGAALPHWHVAVWVTDQSLAVQSQRSLHRATTMLVFLFLAALLLGGLVLLRQAHRDRRDAHQKTSFVSNVSHELKTPLTSIRMYAELLAEDRVTDTAKRARYLEVIAAESQRLTRLVNNVLDFGRLEEGRKKYEVEVFDAATFCAQVVEAQSLRVADAGFSVRLTEPEQAVRVRFDRDALEQILLNLIDNAVKYGASKEHPVIDLELRGGESPEIDVMDVGPGVPARHRDRVFSKFHRVDESLTARQQGSGLGLSIARRLARDLGGDVMYLQRSGGGSIFRVRLPGEGGEA